MSKSEAQPFCADSTKSDGSTGEKCRDGDRRSFTLNVAGAGALPSTPVFAGETGQLNRDDLVTRARFILKGRQVRERHFNAAIFGEPAWDVLLALYICDASGARQTIGKLSQSIKSPPTTVLRWIGYLEGERLVERQQHPHDRRIVFIRLLEKGRLALDEYLRAIPG